MTRQTKITAEDARAIVADPRTQREIAATYNICSSVVSAIKRGHSWKRATAGVVDIRGRGASKITEADAVVIRSDPRDSREVAQAFNICRHHVYRIRSGERWPNARDNK